jgi:hypothetical protein
MDKKLTPESEVWYNEDHADVFQLMWDNDIVTLTKKDVPVLRDILDNWIMIR